MAHRETAYQIITRQADRIRELEELLRFYDHQSLPQAITGSMSYTGGITSPPVAPPSVALPPSMSPLIFLEKLFEKQREWTRSEINRRGRSEHGYTSDEIFQAAQPLFDKHIDVFTEYTENGQKYFVWSARPGWPKDQK